MINYIRNKYSRGYTLIEVMISVAIFGIIGAVLFGDTPSIGKAVAFNTEANLITDIVRDIQIKGSSGYVGTNDNVASSTKYTGLGLTFSTAENKITVFADNKDAINERGVYEGNKYFNNGDKKITTSALSGVSVKDSVWNIELKESKINRIFIGKNLLASTTPSIGGIDNTQASVVFQRGDTKAYITDLTVLSANISPTTSPIFIELISQKLSAYRCVVIEYSGSARVENGKCVEYGSVSVANPASLIPIPPTIVTATPPYFTQISGTCGLTNLGNVNCWGYGGYGQIGGGSVIVPASQSSGATKVLGESGIGSLLSNVAQITAGSGSVFDWHNCALTTLVNSGNVYCWGLGTSGQLGNGSTTDRSTPVKVKGGQSGDTYLSNIKEISAGQYYTCALTTLVNSGNVYCWGLGTSGQLGNGSTANSSIPVKVLAGEQSGSGYLSNVTQIAANGSITCALTTSKNVYCWGGKNWPWLGNGSVSSSTPIKVLKGEYNSNDNYLSNVIKITRGPDNTCALTTSGNATSGNVYCWGYGFFGQLGNNTGGSIFNQAQTPVKVLEGEYDSNDNYLSDVTQIRASGDRTCALTTSENVYCWGRAMWLGINTSEDTWIKTPVKVKGVSGNEYLSGVTEFTGDICAIINLTNSIYCWGRIPTPLSISPAL